MLKGCDDVINMINKLFGSQELATKETQFSRKSDSDLLKELRYPRIEEGESRVANCELFKPEIVEDFEK